MPLVMLCGGPATGKTTRAYEIKDFFEKLFGKKVIIISEDETIAKMGYEKNETYIESAKEKNVRSFLKSEVVRVLDQNTIVIFDGPNYIKGYRYELYCAAKAANTNHCVVYTIRNHEKAWLSNVERDATTEIIVRGQTMKVDPVNHVPFNKEVFRNLMFDRFEEPDASSRWDSPLFSVQTKTRLEMHEIFSAMQNLKAQPQNASTKSIPVGSSNFLYDVDRLMQTITKEILVAKRLHVGRLTFPDYPGCALETEFMQSITPQKLLRMRRQFLTYVKMNHANEDLEKIGRHFLQYLRNYTAH